MSIPENFTAALSKHASVFDDQAILDDDKELWLIRVPENMTQEELSSMKFKLPGEKASKKALGKMEKDNEKYGIYKVPTSQTLKTESDDDEEEGEVDIGVSGQEMVSFECLVPSQDNNGKLVYAPKKFSQYLIVNQMVDIPDTTILAQSILDRPVYKRDQPEGLTMRYKPYGYYSGHTEAVNNKQEEESHKRKRAKKDDEKKKVKKEKKEKKKTA